MIRFTTIDYRPSVPERDSHAGPGETRNTAHGDFARGQRAEHVRTFAHGQFATGMRRTGAPISIGDFATGMRRAGGPISTGDFATGMRATPIGKLPGHESDAGWSSLPLAA